MVKCNLNKKQIFPTNYNIKQQELKNKRRKQHLRIKKIRKQEKQKRFIQKVKLKNKLKKELENKKILGLLKEAVKLMG